MEGAEAEAEVTAEAEVDADADRALSVSVGVESGRLAYDPFTEQKRRMSGRTG